LLTRSVGRRITSKAIYGKARRIGFPAVVRRLKADDEAYGRMRGILFDQPSPGVKASFPRILAQARTLDADLRNWCRAEYSKEEGVFVAEVGMDLIAGQCRLVRQSVFDLLSGRDV
jgi:hypothetical protein